MKQTLRASITAIIVHHEAILRIEPFDGERSRDSRQVDGDNVSLGNVGQELCLAELGAGKAIASRGEIAAGDHVHQVNSIGVRLDVPQVQPQARPSGIGRLKLLFAWFPVGIAVVIVSEQWVCPQHEPLPGPGTIDAKARAVQ